MTHAVTRWQCHGWLLGSETGQAVQRRLCHLSKIHDSLLKYFYGSVLYGAAAMDSLEWLGATTVNCSC